MRDGLFYKLHSGKNSKAAYYLCAYLRECVPSWLSRSEGHRLQQEIDRRPDSDYIRSRIDYYCRLSCPAPLPATAMRLGDWRVPKKQKVYYFDSAEITRFFPSDLCWQILPGDIVHVPDSPTIVKSRPLVANNENSVLLKMDKVRHFIFVDDTIRWEDKQPIAVFRGKVSGKESRVRFMQQYFGSSVCDCGDVSKDPALPAEWQTRKLTIGEHLRYRYIMALEGNDVASNLKWVMSSNSIAVMPRPTCETWFMEGTLIPNYHYIECRADFSDLAERLAYYNAHPAEAQAIIEHAHAFVAPFRDAHREKLIAYGTMAKYLCLTNPQ